jgi:hypothetical protein
MSDDLESQLKAALRPLPPREQFSVQLLAQVTVAGATPIQARSLSPVRRPLAWWLSASLAASVALGVGVHEHLQERRLQQSGLEARREVLEALRVTSQKLDLAYEAVKSRSTSAPFEKTGA